MANHYENFSPYRLSREQIVKLGFPRMNPLGKAVITKDPIFCNNTTGAQFSNPLEPCVRCGNVFSILYEKAEQCLYHWGKLRSVFWTCCDAPEDSRGCSLASSHVWSGLRSFPSTFGPLEGYLRTIPGIHQLGYINPFIYALDCEMVFTRGGMNLARVTVVAVNGRKVYNWLVRPESRIIDYNTRFSGITAQDYRSGPFKTLREVQRDLMGFISAETILVGHGLENDLRALQLVHPTIVDTSIVFPHHLGLPYKHGLKSLVSRVLGREIQESESGHDSYEDAWACIELMMWKIRKDQEEQEQYATLEEAC